MKLEQIIIGFVLFSMFVVGGSLIYNNMAQSYDINVNKSMFNGTMDETGYNDSVYGALDDLDDIVDDSQGGIFTSDDQIDEDDAESNLFSQGFKTIRFIGGTFTVMNKIIGQISNTIGIPSFIGTGIFIMFVSSVLFSIVYLIWRFKP